jgi:hypothetical protein
MMGVRSMCLLPLLLIFCVLGAKAQCDLSLTETHTNLSCPWSYDGSVEPLGYVICKSLVISR